MSSAEDSAPNMVGSPHAQLQSQVEASDASPAAAALADAGRSPVQRLSARQLSVTLSASTMASMRSCPSADSFTASWSNPSGVAGSAECGLLREISDLGLFEQSDCSSTGEPWRCTLRARVGARVLAAGVLHSISADPEQFTASVCTLSDLTPRDVRRVEEWLGEAAEALPAVQRRAARARPAGQRAPRNDEVGESDDDAGSGGDSDGSIEARRRAEGLRERMNPHEACVVSQRVLCRRRHAATARRHHARQALPRPHAASPPNRGAFAASADDDGDDAADCVSEATAVSRSSVCAVDLGLDSGAPPPILARRGTLPCTAEGGPPELVSPTSLASPTAELARRPTQLTRRPTAPQLMTPMLSGSAATFVLSRSGSLSNSASQPSSPAHGDAPSSPTGPRRTLSSSQVDKLRDAAAGKKRGKRRASAGGDGATCGATAAGPLVEQAQSAPLQL
jgi:hypothetical protein